MSKVEPLYQRVGISMQIWISFLKYLAALLKWKQEFVTSRGQFVSIFSRYPLHVELYMVILTFKTWFIRVIEFSWHGEGNRNTKLGPQISIFCLCYVYYRNQTLTLSLNFSLLLSSQIHSLVKHWPYYKTQDLPILSWFCQVSCVLLVKI